MAYDCFNPGKIWKDTNGERIHAHGGSVLFADDIFYWYGENKEKSTAGSGIWHWGVRCYRSKDLYNWEDIGIICPPELEDKENPIHYTQYMDRPHIIYNKKTKKYVMWIKIMDNKNTAHQYMVIQTADEITGPYTGMKHWEPEGMSSGDFDLVKDDETNKAYMFFDTVHSHIACADLNEDYTDVSGEITLHMSYAHRTLGREAPAFFTRNGIKYLMVSQTTGYFPNPTECFESGDYHGPWNNLGYVHKNDTERLSFRSQISSVFKHPYNKDLYIAVADRWLPKLPEDMPHNWLEIIESDANPDMELIIPKEEYERFCSYNKPATRDTSIADYVWLPIEFDGDTPYIKWYDTWRIEDFD